MKTYHDFGKNLDRFGRSDKGDDKGNQANKACGVKILGFSGCSADLCNFISRRWEGVTNVVFHVWTCGVG